MSTIMPPYAPSVPSIFGGIITGGDVEQAVIATLKKWASTYLAELERQKGYVTGSLPRINSWQIAPSMDNWPEDQLPAVIVVSPGVAEPPVRRGDGWMSVRWGVGLGVVCSARTQAESHTLGMLYLAALRTALLQNPSLGGVAAGVNWVDESYDSLPFDDVRSLGAGEGIFAVQVEEVLSTEAGPSRPDPPAPPADTDPWPDWPEAEHVEVDVDGNVVVKPNP